MMNLLNISFANKLRLFFGFIFILLGILTFSTASIITNLEHAVTVKENLSNFYENSKRNAKHLTDFWKPGERDEDKKKE